MAAAEMDIVANIPMNKAWDMFEKPQNYRWQSDVFQVEVLDEYRFTEYHEEGRMKFTLTKRDFYERLEYNIETDDATGHRIILFMEERNGTRIALMDEFRAKKLIGNATLAGNMNKRLSRMEKDIREYCRKTI